MSSIPSPRLLRDRIAQLVYIRIGSNLPPIVQVSEDEERIAKLIEQLPIGGLLLFNGRWPEGKHTLDRLQQLNRQQSPQRSPLLVCADFERGAGQQMHGLTVFPHARALGGTQPEQLKRLGASARITAQESLAAGVQVLFAPVADANTNPRNPIVATRAFGDSPESVAASVAEYVEHAEAAGAVTTAKHFPGHGDTEQDSHDSLPVVPRSLGELQTSELVPFRAAIEAGVSIIMTAHVAYPQLDPTGTPATLSRPITTGLLREQLGFDGVVCTDSLLMAGARDRFDSEGELCAAALRAGVDMLVDLAEPIETVDYLVQAVQSGELDEALVDRSIERVMKLKQRAFDQPTPVLDEPHLAQATEIAAETAREAITLSQPGDSPVLPLPTDKPLTAVLLKPFELPTDPPEQPLAAALRANFADVNYFEFGPEPPSDAVTQIKNALEPGGTLLLALIVKPAAWHAFGLNEGQQRIVDIAQQHEAIIASLGIEGEYHKLGKAFLCTYSDVPASQYALVDRLLEA